MAGATAEDESAMVDGAGLNMAAGPGLSVAMEPSSQGSRPCFIPSPQGRGTELPGDRLGLSPQQTSQGDEGA